jgi:hypothetical protein
MIQVEQQLHMYKFCTVTLGVILCICDVADYFFTEKKVMVENIYDITSPYIVITDLNYGDYLVLFDFCSVG